MAVEQLLLLDKSAYVHGARALGLDGELCLCAITRVELLYSARSPRDYVALEADLDEFRQLRVDAETLTTAAAAQRDLAQQSHHRVPIPDLLIAACAHRHGADVLHRDRDYDVLASALTFDAIRI